ncbi:MAG: ABC transporter substrate-binding protein, partial [Bradymonadia bacterium]
VVVCESISVSRWHGMAAATRIAGEQEHRHFGLKLFGLLSLIVCTGLLPSQREVLNTAKSKTEVSNDSQQIRSIRIQLNWFPDPQFGGFYAAETLGYFDETGLDVTLIQGGPGVATPQMVATGEVEFAVVGGDQVLTNRAQGAPIVAVYAAYNTYPRAFMVHESAPYRSLDELWQSDAKVAVEPGLPFVKWMQQRYDGNALTLIPSGGGLASFQRDLTLAQAVFVTSEPVTMKKRGIPVKIFPVAQSGYNPYTVVLATNERFLRQHSDVAAKVVSAVRKGWAAYLADPEPINRRMAELNADMTVETMNIGAEISETYVRPPHPLTLGEMTTTRWQSLGLQLKQVGAISGEVPSAEACFSNVGISHVEGADVDHE